MNKVVTYQFKIGFANEMTDILFGAGKKII